MRSDHRRFAVLCLLAYVLLAWLARFDMRLGAQMRSLVYPLDTFSMYGRMPADRVGHLLMRDAQGETHRITSFRTFACDAPIAGPDAACRERSDIHYLSADHTNYMRDHPGGGDEAVELILRTWDVRGDLAHTDCVIARCRVSR